MTERLLTASALMSKLRISSRTTLSKVRRSEGFPAPIHPTDTRTPRWREADVDDWIRRRSAEANVARARVVNLEVH